jgi:hypothetical protein
MVDPGPGELPVVARLRAAQPLAAMPPAVETLAALVALELAELELAELEPVEPVVPPRAAQQMPVAVVQVATQVMAGTRCRVRRSGTMVQGPMPKP